MNFKKHVLTSRKTCFATIVSTAMEENIISQKWNSIIGKRKNGMKNGIE